MTKLVVENLTKEYPTRGEPLRVLRGVSFTLAGGENLAVVGPSGSGKSTLLQVVGTLDRPSGGQVRLDEADPFVLAEPELADFRNRKIGFIFQDHHLLGQCSVLENVLLPALAKGNASHDQVARARQLVERVGLADRSEHRPAELSGGERQRVAVARAMILEPQLLLADEPTGNLDGQTAREIGELLLDVQEEAGAILIVVTHSPDLAATMQRTSRLEAGQLVT
ncbi:MAG: ABC transporter ATP-binding protein [Planctomycetota bacterium]|nr:MAG: ABC transporter ATP-binding protein [Planctomycetota bacterium]REJ92873.1 MAG: ABC transporter ATP-binding protein [Planctomycetota bacterium]REK27914.1 MAG: ABC transporter ATP-binding protein [Planctomycetota bacterium]REK40353.1 MAG: ABC transporter ATP-binding protein [Planctomycetota bacterium]